MTRLSLYIVGFYLFGVSGAFAQESDRQKLIESIASKIDVVDISRYAQGRDITDALQKAITSQHQHKLPIYVPAGEWECRGITIPKRSGHHIIWGGKGELVRDSRMAGKECIVRHTGDPDTPLITDHGTHLTMEGGATFIGHGKGKGVGYLQSKHSAGLGNGKTYWRGVYEFRGFGYGIQIGSSVSMHNCESNDFGTVGFSQCNYGLMLVNTQGMGHHIEYLGSDSSTDWLVGVQGGGMVSVDGVMLSCGLLKFIKVEGRGQASKANAYYEFRNIKIDAGNARSVLRIDNSVGVKAAITLQGGINSNSADRYTMAKLSGACSLTVRDFRGWHGIECEAGKSGKPNVVLDRCGLWNWGPRTEGDCYFTMRDCFLYDTGEPVISPPSSPAAE